MDSEQESLNEAMRAFILVKRECRKEKPVNAFPVGPDPIEISFYEEIDLPRTKLGGLLGRIRKVYYILGPYVWVPKRGQWMKAIRIPANILRGDFSYDTIATVIPWRKKEDEDGFVTKPLI